MKFIYTRVLVLAAATFMLYSSCKKVDNKPSSKIDEKAIATQIALSLTKSLRGQFSEVNLTSGINSNGAKSPRLRAFSTNPDCGATVDTVINRESSDGDTLFVKSAQHYTFIKTCDENTPNGYIYTDSFNSSTTLPGAEYLMAIGINYNVKSLNSTYTLVSLFGTQSSTYQENHTKAPVSSFMQHNEYVLNDVKLDVANRSMPNILSGIATFTSNGAKNGEFFNYQGTLEYIGGYKALIKFDGKTFEFNFISGITRPL